MSAATNDLRPYLGRSVDRSAAVRVYRNLRGRHGRWSIMQRGRVVAHADRVMLLDVRFIVQPGGVARIRRTGRKNVCAFAVGVLAPVPVDDQALPERLTFRIDRGAFTLTSAAGVDWTAVSARVALLSEHGLSADSVGYR